MKLALYSDQIHKNTMEMTGKLFSGIDSKQPKIGYLPSCPDSTRYFYLERQKYYSSFNGSLSPYVDLEEGYNQELVDQLFETDAIHLSGGNTYRFLYWLRRRELLERLTKYVANGGILIGVSAGSILMTPDTTTSALCGDINLVNLSDTTGLNLVSYHYLPHTKKGSFQFAKAVRLSKEKDISIVIADDADGVLIDGNRVEIFGNPAIVVSGELTEDVSKLLTGAL